MTESLLSVIIPVYNGERYISDAIDSVLAQNYSPIEIIVVDDGSTDSTKKVLKKYKDQIVYIYKKNGGISSARNAGLDAVKGEFIAFIDADDIWHPSKLKKQFSLFDEYKSLEIAIGLSIDFEGTLIEKKEKTFRLTLGNSLFKKPVFKKVGRFDEELELGEDTDWFFRARENNISVAVHKDVVTFYRRHDNNITKDKKKFNFYVFKVLKKAKDRKRNGSSGSVTDMAKPNNMEELIEIWHTVEKFEKK
ncbi:MAG: glycosyltransferase family 2 protein [Balneolaceae bacterium]|nr:glycosyltransferase family 2 protein [Balneolaceae bacterium]